MLTKPAFLTFSQRLLLNFNRCWTFGFEFLLKKQKLPKLDKTISHKLFFFFLLSDNQNFVGWERFSEKHHHFLWQNCCHCWEETICLMERQAARLEPSEKLSRRKKGCLLTQTSSQAVTNLWNSLCRYAMKTGVIFWRTFWTKKLIHRRHHVRVKKKGSA